MMQKNLFLFVVLMMLAPAQAAPIWVERQFIPSPELVADVFAVHAEESETRVDHDLWAELLAEYLVIGEDGINRVRYGAITGDARAKLDRYLAALQQVDPRTLSRAEQLAFWVNLYNAETVRRIADAYPVSSIRKIDDVWADQGLTVLGQPLSLGEIEHHIVRAVFPDPRIHYALNCASIGCPNLVPNPFTGDTLEQMLADAATAYVNHPRGVRIEDGDVIVSKIYGWYRDDFGGSERAALEHILTLANPDLGARLRDIDDIDAYRYDWDLNDAEPVGE